MIENPNNGQDIKAQENQFRKLLDDINTNDQELIKLTQDIQNITPEYQDLKNKGKLNESEATRYLYLKGQLITLQKMKNDRLVANTKKAEQLATSESNGASNKNGVGVIDFEANGLDNFARRSAQ